MISRRFCLKSIAMLATAVCLAAPANAQVTIRVEESTATQSRGEAQPIDIQIPRSGEQKVQLTTATDELTTDTEDDGDSINLTPAEFRARQAVQTQSTAQVIDEITTTTPVTDPASDSPSGIPVLSTGVFDDGTTESEEPVGLAPTAPSADETTATQSPAPADETSETTETESTSASDVDYFPPANLAKQDTVKRDGSEVPVRPEQLNPAQLDVTVPDVHHTTLTSGIRFYYLEDRGLPRVRVTMMLDAGKNADPAEMVGLAEITARTMRSGGAAGKSGDEIDRELEQIGSDLELNVEHDHVSGSMFALSDKVDEAVSLLADVLMKPEFEEKKFDQQIARAMEELRRQNDQPADISRREFRKIIYGEDHPLARTPTSSTISAISRDDVRSFHEARYRPSTLWIGLVGDISQDEARKLVETEFAEWDRPEAEKTPMPPMVDKPVSTGTVYLTPRATAQSQIRMGHIGLDRRSQKAYAANVLNSIYGMGGFSSRLMNEVRTKGGYAYGVGGGIFSDDPVGLFAAIASTQPNTTVAAIKEMINVTKGVVEGPISEDEMETARRDVVYGFVTQFNTPHQAIATHMLHDYRGYAEDYLATFPEKIRSVTLEDVKKVASELIQPDNLVIYVIGNESALDEPLTLFGEVQNWELEDYSNM